MRSAETSGVGARGFGIPEGNRTWLRSGLATLALPFRRLGSEISPVTIAVALTALCAAGLSVAADTVRTLEESRSRADLIARLGAAQPAADWPLGAEAMVTLAGPDHQGSALDGVWLRGAGALGAALAVTGLCFWRRRRSDHALTRQLRRHQDLLAIVPFGIACWTDRGQLAVCNENYRQRLDCDGASIRPGASYEDTVKHLIGDGSMQVMREDQGNRVLELRRQDGSCLLIDERPLSGGGFVTLVSDVTERRQTDSMLANIREEQLQLARRYREERLRAEAASRSKTAFLAHLSHDIRTPLNHIIGFSEMMRQQTFGPLGDARYLDYVESMRDSGERLLNFFASILELAELESGRKALQAEAFPADELLRGVTRRFAAQGQQARVTLALGTPCGAWVLGDRFALERMLGNLVENSIRFTPAGGRVTIAAFAAADGVVFEVTDTGIGMDEERLANLSQPFALGDATFARDHGGAGLGVAIARAIAEVSGGRLAIDSRPALGTTVAISLPLAATEHTEQAVAA